MRSSGLSHLAWRRSSRSDDGGNANCVEVAELAGGVGLRDAKDPDGPVLAFPGHEWRRFLGSVRTDRFG